MLGFRGLGVQGSRGQGSILESYQILGFAAEGLDGRGVVDCHTALPLDPKSFR